MDEPDGRNETDGTEEPMDRMDREARLVQRQVPLLLVEPGRTGEAMASADLLIHLYAIAWPVGWRDPSVSEPVGGVVLRQLVEQGRMRLGQGYWVIIFPEGTRSKDGVPKRFSENGLKMLVKKTPSGYVVPVTINNSWKTVRYGHFPLEVFVDLSIEVHQPVKNSDLPFEELFLKVEKEIKDAVIV